MSSKDCVKAITDFCKNNTALLKKQFVEITDEEIALSFIEKNWKRDIKRKIEGNKTERVFDCRPFDDQLRAYVITDDADQILSVTVTGE